MLNNLIHYFQKGGKYMDYILTDIHFHTNLSYDAYENKNKGRFDLNLLINNEMISKNKVG